ncbi:MAG: response regulator [Bdellovibrionales bacterium]
MFDLNTKILVVDDMNTMRKIVIKACREIGFSNFVEAPDGAIAWERLSSSQEEIGLVISDWNMPNCTGLELLKNVRTDEKMKSMPFILLTAESEVVQVKEALEAGVDNYIVKPFTKDILKRKLQDTYKKIHA